MPADLIWLAIMLDPSGPANILDVIGVGLIPVTKNARSQLPKTLHRGVSEEGWSVRAGVSDSTLHFVSQPSLCESQTRPTLTVKHHEQVTVRRCEPNQCVAWHCWATLLPGARWWCTSDRQSICEYQRCFLLANDLCYCTFTMQVHVRLAKGRTHPEATPCR